MTVKAIIACDQNSGIGNEGNLPWPKNKKDMDWFRKNTMGNVVLMGRSTWESIGSKPLPNRENVVVSSGVVENAGLSMSGDMGDIIDYVEELYEGLDIWIIGGANIYKQAIPYCDKLYLTAMKQCYKCDRYIESDIITEFPVIEHWEEDDEMTIQIRSR